VIAFNEILGMNGEIQACIISTKIPEECLIGSFLNSLTGACVIALLN
jgi:hypothetical protein